MKYQTKSGGGESFVLIVTILSARPVIVSSPHNVGHTADRRCQPQVIRIVSFNSDSKPKAVQCRGPNQMCHQTVLRAGLVRQLHTGAVERAGDKGCRLDSSCRPSQLAGQSEHSLCTLVLAQMGDGIHFDRRISRVSLLYILCSSAVIPCGLI